MTAQATSRAATATFRVEPGETVVCTFRNLKLGTLVVRKQTVPAETTTRFAFTAGGGLDPASFTLSDGEARTFAGLEPATYSLAELVPDGWRHLGASCDDGSPIAGIAVAPGETVVCTFTNAVIFVLGGGAFVIGDENDAVGTHVTFWGAQWWKLNTLSGGDSPAEFKGFAKNPRTRSAARPWSTDPGNSAPPPDGPLPSFMGVIVTSSTGKSGSAITGNTPHMVIVRTNPGYSPNPGHAGTGTVVSSVC